MHKKADNPYVAECRGDVIISRGMPIQSHVLRLAGIADVVEFRRGSTGVTVPDHAGCWEIIPVEYKVGKKKQEDCDIVQLCAQAICLEEMFTTQISHGYLYYGKTRRRSEVLFTDDLRERVRVLVSEMYLLYERGITPAAISGSYCQSCSLKDICVPKLSENWQSIDIYLNKMS